MCLEDFGITAASILTQESEKAAVDAWFAVNSQLAERVCMAPDGSCSIAAAWTFVRRVRQTDPAFLRDIQSQSRLQAQIGRRAIDAINKSMLPPADKETLASVWTTIAGNAKELKKNWSSDALNFVWHGLAGLSDRFCIRVWQWMPSIKDLGLLVTYGKGDIEMDVLYLFPNVLSHYDLMLWSSPEARQQAEARARAKFK